MRKKKVGCRTEWLEREYLKEEALKGFESYKYNSVDTSPLSVYVMHPFWNWVVNHFCPSWIAPNLLTFLGFLACVAHFGLLSIFDYEFKDPGMNIPRWVWLGASLLLFLSHTLDGIDGKQARRTGTSGPLGELFDHGLDSWSATFITVSLYSVFGRDPDSSISVFRMYFVLWAVFLNFQYSHFEKYNTGIMYLPWAYDLSMITGSLLYLLTFFVTPSFYHQTQFPISPGRALEFILYVGSVGFTVPVATYNIYISYRDGTGKNRPLLEAIRPMLSYTSAFFICAAWTVLFPAALELDPRCFFFMTGVLYTNIACRLIVAQMSGTRTECFNYLLIPTIFAVLTCAFLPMEHHVGVLYVLTLIITVAHAHYGICVVRQMCRHFNVQCFKINARSGENDQQRLLSTSTADENDGDNINEAVVEIV